MEQRWHPHGSCPSKRHLERVADRTRHPTGTPCDPQHPFPGPHSLGAVGNLCITMHVDTYMWSGLHTHQSVAGFVSREEQGVLLSFDAEMHTQLLGHSAAQSHLTMSFQIPQHRSALAVLYHCAPPGELESGVQQKSSCSAFVGRAAGIPGGAAPVLLPGGTSCDGSEEPQSPQS